MAGALQPRMPWCPQLPRHVMRSATIVMMLGCPRNGDGNTGSLGRPAADDGGGRVLRVGNPSRGVDEQPDYDGLARDLRTRVVNRLPATLPPVKEACTAMLDAAVAMYRRTETDGSAQAARLTASRAADLAACEAQTSAQAAVCATLLLGDEDGEWPWLLDQCTRAFPRASASSG